METHFMRRILQILLLLILAGIFSSSVLAKTSRPSDYEATIRQSESVEKVSDGIVIPVGGAILKVEVCGQDVIRVAYAKDRAFFARKTLAAEPKRCEPTQWQFAKGVHEATISTAMLKARVDLTTGAITFFTSAGKPILVEERD